jgi:hypothetical protein
MKAVAVTETLLIIGMIAVSAVMFVKIPGEINDLKQLFAISSANAVAKDIAGLLTTAAISPHSMTLFYSFPEEAFYNVSFKNYTVYVDASWENLVRVENSSAKSAVDITAQFNDVKALKIYKSLENNQNSWGVEQYE